MVIGDFSDFGMYRTNFLNLQRNIGEFLMANRLVIKICKAKNMYDEFRRDKMQSYYNVIV